MELIDRNKYLDKVFSFIGKGLIIVLTGQHRVGKSCIMQCVARRIKKEDKHANIIYI